MPIRIATLLFILIAFFISACDLVGADNEAQPDEPPIAGTYRTVVFEVTYQDGETVDMGQYGAFVEVTLEEGEEASGRMFVPASALRDEDFEDDQEGDVDVPFGGTYQVHGDTVTFDHQADTFIRDDAWLLEDGRLRNVGDFPGTVVLERE